jgi:hypothetical protein
MGAQMKYVRPFPWRMRLCLLIGMLSALPAFSQVQPPGGVPCVACDPLLSSHDDVPQGQRLDDFNSLHGWNIHKSDGVHIALSQAEGKDGESLCMEFDFLKGSGYGGIN